MSRFETKNLFGGCPPFFQEFQIACCQTAGRQAMAEASGLKITSDSWSHYYVDGLAHVARHWRLANALTEIDAYSVSKEVRDATLALLKNQMSIATLECYAALYQMNWWDLEVDLLAELEADYPTTLRRIFKDTPAKKMKPERDSLIRRWNRFLEGDDQEILGVAVALRHAFAHGKIWGANELQPEVLKLADGVLAAIRSDVETRTRELDS